MAKVIENVKGFKVIEVTQDELMTKLGRYGSLGICDSCNDAAPSGYYIAVLNHWICPHCYKDWTQRAKWYKEDSVIEERNFKRYKELFDVDKELSVEVESDKHISDEG